MRRGLSLLFDREDRCPSGLFSYLAIYHGVDVVVKEIYYTESTLLITEL